MLSSERNTRPPERVRNMNHRSLAGDAEKQERSEGESD